MGGAKLEVHTGDTPALSRGLHNTCPEGIRVEDRSTNTADEDRTGLTAVSKSLAEDHRDEATLRDHISAESPITTTVLSSLPSASMCGLCSQFVICSSS